MISSLTDIIKIPLAVLAGIIVAAVVLIFLYEGLRLPLIGQVINGRVASQVELATSTMATKAELAAATAIADLERAKRVASDTMAMEEAKRAGEALREQERQEAEIDRLKKEAAATDGLTYPSEEDMKWVGSH